jgi:phage head maturation protease
VLLVSHDIVKLPIGRVDNVRVVGRELHGDLVLDMSDATAQDVDRKIRERMVNAVSISFNVLRTQNGRAVEWELLEVSIVSVPMDTDALVQARSATRGHRLATATKYGLTLAEYELMLDEIAAFVLDRWFEQEDYWHQLSDLVDLDVPRERHR